MASKPSNVRLEFKTPPPRLSRGVLDLLPAPTRKLGRALEAAGKRIPAEVEFGYLKALSSGAYLRRAQSHLGRLINSGSMESSSQALATRLVEELGSLESVRTSSGRWFRELSGLASGDGRVLTTKALEISGKSIRSVIKANPLGAAAYGARLMAPYAGALIDRVLSRAIQDPAVTMSILRQVPDEIARQVQAAIGVPMDTLTAAGEFGLELEKALRSQGMTLNLASRGFKPLVVITDAGRDLRGHVSVASFGNKSARFWVHVRRDSVGTAVDVLKSPAVQRAAKRLADSTKDVKLPSWLTGTPKPGMIAQLKKRLNPANLERNVWAALRPPSRAVLRDAFRRAPVAAKLGAVMKVGGQILVYKSFVDFVKGRDMTTFPATVFLPGPLRVIWFVGKFIGGLLSKKKQKRAAKAAEAARQKAIADYNKAVAEAWKRYYEHKRWTEERQRTMRRGTQHFKGRIASFLVRM